MAQAEVKITLAVKVACWLPWYLRGVALMSRMTGLEPDEDKLGYWIDKGIKIETKRWEG